MRHFFYNHSPPSKKVICGKIKSLILEWKREYSKPKKEKNEKPKKPIESIYKVNTIAFTKPNIYDISQEEY
jgi:hypothetical protein